jgi:hypothetical protein
VTDYTEEDIARALRWYRRHKIYVDKLIKIGKAEFPMSGSDIMHPELWKPGGWRWFFKQYSSQEE